MKTTTPMARAVTAVMPILIGTNDEEVEEEAACFSPPLPSLVSLMGLKVSSFLSFLLDKLLEAALAGVDKAAAVLEKAALMKLLAPALSELAVIEAFILSAVMPEDLANSIASRSEASFVMTISSLFSAKAKVW